MTGKLTQEQPFAQAGVSLDGAADSGAHFYLHSGTADRAVDAQPPGNRVGAKSAAIAAESEGRRHEGGGQRNQGGDTSDPGTEGVAEEVGREADPGLPRKFACSVKTRSWKRVTY